jgi:formylglycine-generating enzyme required for sulfatase activity
MADIFISYSNSDGTLTERLAKDLSGRGYSVWWDTGLLGGENFRQVIARELAAAQVAIVIWTQDSVRSEWVLSEAEQARAQGKLLPVRARTLNPAAIPMPFGVFHTEVIDERDRIAAAVVARLQQPGSSAPVPGAIETWPDASRTGRSVGPQSLAGTEFRDMPDAPLLVVVPAGGFLMGSPSSEVGRDKIEGPQRRVRIGAPLAVGRFPVTFKEWDLFSERTRSAYRPADNGWGRGELPVVNVSWDDAATYCAWLSNTTGHAYRLPTEAEWEYCCRAGTTTRYFLGDTISAEQANFNASAHPLPGSSNAFRRRTTPAGQFPANGFGLSDMHGNVSEWVEDPWHEDYVQAPTDGSAWNGIGARRVLRGGSWYDYPQHVRSAHRAWAVPSERAKNIGFRVCRVLEDRPR